MRSNTVWVTLSGKTGFLDAEKFNAHAVILLTAPFTPWFDFAFNLLQLEFRGIRVHEVGQTVLADDRLLGAAHDSFNLGCAARSRR